MRRTNVWLKLTEIRDLKSIARERGATVAGLIRLAIDQFIERWKAAKESIYHGKSEE
jgi:hypothetical protein